MAQRLQSIRFFSNMDEGDLNQIAQITVERHFPAGEVIIEENTPADRFYLISQGKVRITKRFEDGEEVELGLQSGGDFFGEIAILDAGPRSATVRALEPTTVLEISRQDFQVLLIQAPELAYAITKELGARLRETGALLVSYLRQRNRDLTQALLGVARAVDSLDAGLLAQFRRIAGIAEAIGRQLGCSEEELLLLKAACLFRLERGPAPPRSPSAGPQGEQWPEWMATLASVLAPRRHEHEAEGREGRRRRRRDAARPFPLERIVTAAVRLASLFEGGPRADPPQEAALRALMQTGGAEPIDPRTWKAVLAVWRSGASTAIPAGEG